MRIGSNRRRRWSCHGRFPFVPRAEHSLDLTKYVSHDSKLLEPNMGCVWMTPSVQSRALARGFVRPLWVGLTPGSVAIAPHDRLRRIFRVIGIRDGQLAEQEPRSCRADFSDISARFAEAVHYRSHSSGGLHTERPFRSCVPPCIFGGGRDRVALGPHYAKHFHRITTQRLDRIRHCRIIVWCSVSSKPGYSLGSFRNI